MENITGPEKSLLEEIEKLRAKLSALEDERRHVFEYRKAASRNQWIMRILSATQKINRLIIREQDSEKLIQKGCHILTRALGYQNAQIVLLNHADVITSIAFSGTREDFFSTGQQLHCADLPLCMKMALENEGAVILKDHPKDICGICPFACSHGFKVGMVSKIQHQGIIHGIMACFSGDRVSVEAEHQIFFKEIADDLGFALSKIADEKKKGEQDALLEAIFKNTPLIMMILDHNLKVVRANSFAGEFSKRPSEELIGLCLGKALGCVHAIDDPRGCAYGKYCDQCTIGQVAGDTLKTGKNHHKVEMTFPLNDHGHEKNFTFLLYTVRLQIEKKTIILITILDITEIKKIENERKLIEQKIRKVQKFESLGMLAGGIAHDFNNILMVILGNAELAFEGLSPISVARGNIREIITAASRAVDLCRQMLTYAGKASLEFEQIDLHELIGEMAHLLKTTISQKVILNLHAESYLPLIYADPGQIRQIITNLVINASEAIGGRSGVITIKSGATRCEEEYLKKTELNDDPDPGLYVYLEITDNGCGIDPENKGRIFEPFYSTKFTGRGLGLAAVLGIVRAHKGAIKVYSELNKGTTFKILFPVCDFKAIAGTSDVSSGEDTVEGWCGTRTILLADDEESLRTLGSNMLEMMGFTVFLARDGKEAVDIYRRKGEEIDLVMLDLTMPNLDGAQAFTELRRLNPDVKVILASGYSEEDISSRFAGKNPAGVLHKPYTLNRLREMLSEIFK